VKLLYRQSKGQTSRIALFKRVYLFIGLFFCAITVVGAFFVIRATTTPVTNTVLLEVQPSVPIISTIESIQLDIGFASFGSKIVIEGTAPPNSAVDIYIQKDETVYFKGKTISDSNGRWKLIVEEIIPPGRYQVWIVATTDVYPDIPSEKKEFLVPELKAQMMVFNVIIVLIEKIRALPALLMIFIILIIIFVMFILIQSLTFLLLYLLRVIIRFGQRSINRLR